MHGPDGEPELPVEQHQGKAEGCFDEKEEQGSEQVKTVFLVFEAQAQGLLRDIPVQNRHVVMKGFVREFKKDPTLEKPL